MRPRMAWLLYTVCLIVVIAAVAVASRTALEAERGEAEARQLAQFEEHARLALTHLDGACLPILTRESSRPGYWYRTLYAAEQPQQTLLTQPMDPAVRRWATSPLWTQAPAQYVRIHFQFDSEGTLSSPQAPGPIESDWIKPLAAAYAAGENGTSRPREKENEKEKTKATEIEEVKVKDKSPGVAVRVDPPEPQSPALEPERYAGWFGELAGSLSFATLRAAVVEADGRGDPNLELQLLANLDPRSGTEPQTLDTENNDSALNFRAPVQQAKSAPEELKQQQALNSFSDLRRSRAVQNALRNDGYTNSRSSKNELDRAPIVPVQEGMLHALWHAGQLLLVRRVTAGEQTFLQGCWLDWSALRRDLLAEINDLLPDADLLPADASGRTSEQRILAALPIRLIPGGPAPYVVSGWSPARRSLLVAWSCGLAAAVAIGLLLHGVLRLSERRASFVSAVTHELRTPLTTLRMYADMLAQQMVPDEARREQYLATLRVEADRLAHLVENVLAYARLERGPQQARLAELTVADLLESVETRLVDRAQQAELTWNIDVADETLAVALRTDATAVEQILFNLVDNAGKYAASAEDRELRLTVVRDGRRLQFRVRDHGPGIADADSGRLFRPFCKSVQQAARSAPGVGLGLALSRRLARQIGGQLDWDRSVRDGACFVLTLPLA